MNTEYNKIDEIFRKALEGAVEQPSSGLWRKISGRLFWKEIAQFNFTNFPVGWAGMAAAGIVIATMVVYNFTPSTPENVVSENISGKNAVEVIQNPASQTFSSTESNKVAPAGKEIAGSAASSNSGITSDKSLDAAAGQINTPSSSNIPSSGVQDGQTSVSTGDGNQNAMPSTNSLDKTATKNGTITTEAAVTLAETAILQVPENDYLQPEIANDANNLSSVSQRQEHEISQLETRKALINEGKDAVVLSQITGTGDGSITAPGSEMTINSERGSGRIQKMHSLSFTLGQFFKGKYKPPKRDYEENNMAKYRGKNHIISLSAYFAPEMTEYTRTASTSREQNYIGGIAVNYNSSSYILQGGLELCFSNDLGDYMVNMETFDSTGYYNNIGSFTIDPENPDSIIFNTVPVTVWDSVGHQSLQQTQNQYTYLQFPFMVGYKAFQRGLFSAYIKAGPCFSFLLNRKEPSLYYYNPDATVQNIDNYTPTRSNTSIQILVSLGMQFQASENFGILVEPTYRYYLRSVYDVQDASLKSPFGIGIRGGFFYNF